MMRLLFLCLLLLLPTTTASESIEGSGDDENDDEDYVGKKVLVSDDLNKSSLGFNNVDKTTGEKSGSDQLTLIIIIAAVTVLTLSVAAIVAVILVRRHMQTRQQGIYSVPTEQGHKGAV